MESYTFNNLINDIFKQNKIPMSCEEIWQSAIDSGLSQKIGTTGKTPWATIGARIYTEIKENSEKSKYLQVSKRPARFILRKLSLSASETVKYVEAKDIEKEKALEKKSFNERDLHPLLLVRYVYSDPHFNCSTKTILHENSTKKTKGANEWLHPDLVGSYFPFTDYLEQTRGLQRGKAQSLMR